MEPTLAWRPGGDAPPAPETGAEAAALAATPAARGPRTLRPSRSLSTVLGAAALLSGGLLGVVLGEPATSSLASSNQPPIVVAVPPAATATPPAAPPATGDDPVADDTVETITVTTEAEAPAAAVEEPVADDTPADTTPVETTPTDTTPTETPTTPHVWVVTLSHQDAPALFGAQAPPYFAELAKQGAVLDGYAPLPGGSLANGVALLSGQAPNPSTLDDCPVLTDVPADALDTTTGLVDGTGCVYPTGVVSLPDQVVATGLTWRAYVQGSGDPCRRPALGEADPWRTVQPPDGRLTARSPFLYFHALTDGDACARSVAASDTLASDLADAKRTPSLSWIVPDAFHDGRAGTNPDGGATGPQDAAAFLQDVIPTITATPAYEQGGLIVLVPDAPATAGAPTGALLLGPGVRPGVRTSAPVGPYHLLRSLEDLLGLGHLGHAGDTTVVPFDKTVYTTDPDAATRRLSHYRTRPGGHVAAHPPAR